MEAHEGQIGKLTRVTAFCGYSEQLRGAYREWWPAGTLVICRGADMSPLEARELSSSLRAEGARHVAWFKTALGALAGAAEEQK